MATPIKDVAAELFISSVNPFTTLDECISAVKAARCKDDHPAVWGTSAKKAIAFFTSPTAVAVIAAADPEAAAVVDSLLPEEPAAPAKPKGLKKGTAAAAPPVVAPEATDPNWHPEYGDA